MLSLKIKDTKGDDNEWVLINFGDKVARVTAKNTRQGISIIIDAPQDIKVVRENIIKKKRRLGEIIRNTDLS